MTSKVQKLGVCYILGSAPMQRPLQTFCLQMSRTAIKRTLFGAYCSIMDSYLRVAEGRAEGSSQMCPQGKSIHNKVLLSGGQLHEAGEALEASVVMMLQVHRNLFGN